MGAVAYDFFFPGKHLLKEIIVYPLILFFHNRHSPVNIELLKKEEERNKEKRYIQTQHILHMQKLK